MSIQSIVTERTTVEGNDFPLYSLVIDNEEGSVDIPEGVCIRFVSCKIQDFVCRGRNSIYLENCVVRGTFTAVDAEIISVTLERPEAGVEVISQYQGEVNLIDVKGFFRDAEFEKDVSISKGSFCEFVDCSFEKTILLASSVSEFLSGFMKDSLILASSSVVLSEVSIDALTDFLVASDGSYFEVYDCRINALNKGILLNGSSSGRLYSSTLRTMYSINDCLTSENGSDVISRGYGFTSVNGYGVKVSSSSAKASVYAPEGSIKSMSGNAVYAAGGEFFGVGLESIESESGIGIELGEGGVVLVKKIASMIKGLNTAIQSDSGRFEGYSIPTIKSDMGIAVDLSGDSVFYIDGSTLIQGNSGEGIKSSDGCVVKAVNVTTITSLLSYAINISESDVVCKDVEKITSIMADGIKASESKLSLEDCGEISGILGHGINMADTHLVVKRAQDIRGVLGSGIYMSTCDCLLIECESIEGIVKDGITASGECQIKDFGSSSIKGIQGGIICGGSSKVSLIKTQRVTGSGSNGIVLPGGYLELKEFGFISGQAAGISVAECQFEILRGTSISGQSAGVDISKSRGKIVEIPSINGKINEASESYVVVSKCQVTGQQSLVLADSIIEIDESRFIGSVALSRYSEVKTDRSVFDGDISSDNSSFKADSVDILKNITASNKSIYCIDKVYFSGDVTVNDSEFRSRIFSNIQKLTATNKSVLLFEKGDFIGDVSVDDSNFTGTALNFSANVSMVDCEISLREWECSAEVEFDEVRGNSEEFSIAGSFRLENSSYIRGCDWTLSGTVDIEDSRIEAKKVEFIGEVNIKATDPDSDRSSFVNIEEITFGNKLTCESSVVEFVRGSVADEVKLTDCRYTFSEFEFEKEITATEGYGKIFRSSCKEVVNIGDYSDPGDKKEGGVVVFDYVTFEKLLSVFYSRVNVLSCEMKQQTYFKYCSARSVNCEFQGTVTVGYGIMPVLTDYTSCNWVSERDTFNGEVSIKGSGSWFTANDFQQLLSLENSKAVMEAGVGKNVTLLSSTLVVCGGELEKVDADIYTGPPPTPYGSAVETYSGIVGEIKLKESVAMCHSTDVGKITGANKEQRCFKGKIVYVATAGFFEDIVGDFKRWVDGDSYEFITGDRFVDVEGGSTHRINKDMFIGVGDDAVGGPGDFLLRTKRDITIEAGRDAVDNCNRDRTEYTRENLTEVVGQEAVKTAVRVIRDRCDKIEHVIYPIPGPNIPTFPNPPQAESPSP